jgi:hypothetical protein
MKTDSIVANLRTLLRANSAIADIHARLLLTRSGLTGFAALIGAFGLLMLGLAGFFALESVWGRIWAAAAVGGVNCLVALALIFMASRLKPGRELELAREVHKSALEALIAEGRSIETEITSFKQAFRHPLDSVLPGLIVPLATVLIKALQKRAEKAHAPDASQT